jgi:hypothetical protein
MKISGIIVMVAGFGLTVFSAFSYFTKEKIFEIGSVEISKSQPHYINLSPFIGIAIMVIGAFIALQAKKK